VAGLKPIWLEFMHFLDLKGTSQSSHLFSYLQRIYNILEDVYSVGSMTELQEAIDSIGAGAGTVFIEAGTHVVDTPIDIDGGGSLVIYGHGDNTILKANDGINVFNITDCASLLIKTLRIDVSNYTGATSSVIVNETNNNIVGFEDVSIVGGGVFGIGIELQSDNCIIEHCDISNLQDGIYLNNSNRHIIAQNILSNNARYGINIDTSLYSSINGNTCNSNLSGIYINSSTNNSISNNICNLNTENGIYLTQSSYNTISGNTCENNDSNTVNSQAGMFITTNSDFNTISGNSLNNNNNIGAGTGYGIIIALNTCNENVVASNNANGNDVDFMDSGTATTITYFVQDAVELQDAIDSIGTKSGIINIEGSFTVSATIIMDGNGSYIIQGEGSNTTLTTIGDISCFNIDTARSVILRNFMIDATSLTTATREIIDVNEDADNIIILDNVIITGDGTNGYGIELNSANCRIENCVIDNINIGINVLSDFNIIKGNNANNCASYGIQVSADYNNITSNICNSNLTGIYVLNGTGNSINNNIVQTNAQNGIYLSGSSNNSLNDNICDGNDSNTANPQAGIYIDNNSDNNSIIGNTTINNNNIGAGEGYGVYIGNANCNNNIVRSNTVSGNDIAWKDVGVNSDFEYRCSTGQDIQDAIDSIALKSGIIHILPIAGGIQLTATIDIDGGGDYVIEGEGVGTVIDCNGDRTAFYITSAKSCVLRNFKIDAIDLTTVGMPIIYIDEASENSVTIEYITIVGDGVNGIGIKFRSDYCIIRNNNIQDVAKGILATTDYSWISDNNCSNNGDIGIELNGGVDAETKGYNVQLRGNQCINNTNYGIYFISFTYGLLHGNICRDNIYGIYGFNADYNTINGNVCVSNTEIGIYLSSSNFSTISGNHTSDNDDGIKLNNCDVCNITGNSCIYNTSNDADPHAGIFITTNSEYNTITGNTSFGNTNTGAGIGYGIFIAGANCDENVVSSNSLKSNNTNYLDNGTGTITIQGGWSGWVDDGINFRITVVDGIITAVNNSTGGGHNP